MVKIIGSPPSFASLDAYKKNMVPLPKYAPMPVITNDSPGEYVTINGNKRVALCRAAPLPVPLPGVLWLPVSPMM